MTTRLNHWNVAPKVMQAMLALEKASRSNGLEPSLLELVKTRASQINRCAFCLDMHTREARAAGETEERLYMLSAWEEATCYTQRERAALAWVDALTRLAETGAPDSAYEAMAAEFSAEEQVALTLAIVTINGWNRFAVGFRAEPARAKAAA
ncbi:carboxymuconolactone decarboxylase family protein [Roseomonas sp. HJA6]|uniref:Carboxymuconolactone decarboxylase family protein n=1 Tax=Roseomonas alba TaxID=2846776 RepID=A0ABS7AJA3_9PROT|nr:carboxymuconolactone decarboxylase family protein [Neoroseomonas alba]MBW6401194.1 carboxymuconolactone decarboxylase family protein [Neoroseomonas alba]